MQLLPMLAAPTLATVLAPAALTQVQTPAPAPAKRRGRPPKTAGARGSISLDPLVLRPRSKVQYFAEGENDV